MKRMLLLAAAATVVCIQAVVAQTLSESQKSKTQSQTAPPQSPRVVQTQKKEAPKETKSAVPKKEDGLAKSKGSNSKKSDDSKAGTAKSKRPAGDFILY